MLELGQSLCVRTLQIFLLLTPLSFFGQANSRYVGARACANCHVGIEHQWAESLHRKMMQSASAASVKGDFAQSKIVLHGSTYLLQNQNGKYFITESDLTGKPRQHRVEYTLGDRRIQQYLTTLPDGRIVVLPSTWDIVRHTWVHTTDIENPEEGGGSGIQIWNKLCYSCHVSGAQKNFDLEHLSYHTTWQDFGVNCEQCHGPGSEHIKVAAIAGKPSAEQRARIKETIVNPARLDPLRSSMICAECHSFRDVYADGFKAGENYSDFFLPVMQYRLPAQDSAYWLDGRPRWLSNEALGLWQSQCFLKGGATCLACHSQPHNVDIADNPQLRPNDNALCLKCHAAIASNISAHTHHAMNSSGSSCVECHMPAVVTSLRTQMRDHSISIPVPENTIRHDIPNACNLCHQDKDANWALQQMTAWYGLKSRQKLIRRADAFAGAAQGDGTVVPELLQILSEPSEGPLIRANAAGYLGGFPDDPSAYDAVFQAFSDPAPLVRSTAIFALRPRAAQRATVAPALASLLRDPVKTVQVGAAIALVAMGLRELPEQDQPWFENAKKLYRARAELDSDDAQQQFAAGRFFELAGDLDSAIFAFRATLKLDDSIPVQYYLAQALSQKGDIESARGILKAIPPNNTQYPAAQRLLTQLESSEARNEASSNGASSPSGADVKFREGQTLYQDGSYGGALNALDEALHLAPQAGWAPKAQIYRAVSMEKLSRFSEAEAAMQPLLATAGTQTDSDLQLAFVELLYDSGRSEEALKRVDGFIDAVPNVPMAYFWRAKILLQLGRADDAAKAAEESVRLLPDSPAAHNLLIRIYQTQGRTAEAAQQAQWVRDYERRVQSR
jgi:tetratricopeptide (TPR) repeat protein